jgi:hypothetical protein
MTAHSTGVKATVTVLLGIDAIIVVREETEQRSVVPTCLFSFFLYKVREMIGMTNREVQSDKDSCDHRSWAEED